MEVPWQLVSCLQAGIVFVGLLCQHRDLPYRSIQSGRQFRQCQTLLSPQQGFCLPENPWVSEASSADHRRRAAGIAEKMNGFFRSKSISVCNHRNSKGLSYFPYNIPVCSSLIHLYPGSSMHCYCGCPGVLTHFGKLHCIDIPAVKSFPDLYGNRD